MINRMTGYLCLFAFCLLLMYGLAAVLIHLEFFTESSGRPGHLIGTILMCIGTIVYSLYMTAEDDVAKGRMPQSSVNLLDPLKGRRWLNLLEPDPEWLSTQAKPRCRSQVALVFIEIESVRSAGSLTTTKATTSFSALHLPWALPSIMAKTGGNWPFPAWDG